MFRPLTDDLETAHRGGSPWCSARAEQGLGQQVRQGIWRMSGIRTTGRGQAAPAGRVSAKAGGGRRRAARLANSAALRRVLRRERLLHVPLIGLAPTARQSVHALGWLSRPGRGAPGPRRILSGTREPRIVDALIPAFPSYTRRGAAKPDQHHHAHFGLVARFSPVMRGRGKRCGLADS
jgi:hypothetical protein